MTSPGGNVVGRVSVKVTPDTKGFRRDTEKELEAETKGLEIEIPIALDTAGLRQRLQAVAAQAGRGVNAEIGVDVNRAELRQFESQLQQAMNRTSQNLSRGGRSGGGGGGNFITKQFTQLFPIIKQLGTALKGLALGVDKVGKSKSVKSLNADLKVSVDTLKKIRAAFAEYDKAVKNSGNSLKNAKNDVAAVDESSRNLPVLWSEANKSMMDIASSVRDAADRAKELEIGPVLDQTAMQKFRSDLKRAFDTIRKDVPSRIFEVGPDGTREMSLLENAARKAADQVRRIADAIGNGVTQATAKLRFAWDGLTSVVRGTPGWIKAIGNSIGSELQSKWDRFTLAVNRTNIEFRSIPQRLSDIGNAIQTGLTRGWIEFDTAANAAITRVTQGMDRLQTGFNRANLEIENGANRIRSAWDTLGTLFNRVNLEAENGAQRVGTAWDSASQRISTAFNRLNLESENSIRNLISMVSSWDSVGGAVDDVTRRVYEFARNLTDADNRTRLIQNVVYDLQRAWATVSLGVDKFVERVRLSESSVNRLRSTWTTLSNAVKNIDVDKAYQGFLRLGNQGVRVSTLLRNSFTGIGQGFKALGTLAVSAFKSIGDGASTLGSAITSGLGTAVSGVGTLFSNIASGIATRISSLVSLIQAVGQLVVIAATLGAISAALAILGAAITAAYGIVAGAVAALPGLILALAAPIAAVMLGMDGIKKAAEVARPAFEKLQKTISDTFQARLTPVFRDLAKAIPNITTDMIGLTNAISLVASDLTKFITSEAGIKLINTALKNVNEALVIMSPGITKIVEGFLKIGAQVAPFQLLTSAVNTFADAWSRSVDKTLANGTFQNAVQRLSDIINAVTIAIVALVENGLKVLETSGPGITKFFESLTGFLNKFDWAALGKAVGDVFQGLGEALDSVPQATIDNIVKSFENLGAVFRDQQFQNMFNGIIEAIPVVINAMAQLIDIFDRTVQFLRGAATVVIGFGQILKGAFDTIILVAKVTKDPMKALNGEFTQGFKDAQKTIQDGAAKMGEGFSSIGDAFAAATPGISTQITASAQAWLKSLDDATKLGLNTVSDTARIGGDGVGAAITLELQKVPAGAKLALDPVATQAGAAMAPVAGAVQKGLSPVPDTAKGVFDQIQPGMQSAFQSLGGVATEGMGNIERGVSDGLIRVRDLFTRGFETMAPLVTTAFDKVKLGVETTMTGMVTAVTTGLTTLTTSFTGMGTVFATFGTQMTQAATNATTLTANLNTVNTSLTTANTSVTTLNTSLTTFNTTLTTINTGITTLVASFVLLNTNVTGLVTLFNGLIVVFTTLIANLTLLNTGLTLLNTTLPLLVTNLTLLNTALTTLNATIALFVTAINNIVIAINILNPAITTFITALTTLGTTFTTLEATITTTMTNITSVIVNALALILQAFITGFAEITASLNTSSLEWIVIVTEATIAMIQVLANAVPQFRAAGENMGQALADGLRSKVGEVQAAAAELANAAAAATKAAAEINSPSKVFSRLGQGLGEGFTLGIDKSRKWVRAAGKRLFHDATLYSKAAQAAWAPKNWAVNLPKETAGNAVEVSRTSINEWRDHTDRDHYGHYFDRIVDAIDGWNVQIDGNGVAKMVNKSNTRKNRRG